MRYKLFLTLFSYLCGLLIALSYGHGIFLVLSSLSIPYLLNLLVTAGKNLRALSVSLFFTSYISFNYSFLIYGEMNIGLEVVLLLIPLAIYIIPQFVFLFQKKYTPEYFLAGWLFSDLFMARMPIGNSLMMIGTTLSNYPVLIQWYEYTGPHWGSFWLLSLFYLLYLSSKTISRWYCPIAFVATSLCFSLWSVQEDKKMPPHKYRNIAALSIESETSVEFIDSLIIANQKNSIDYLIGSETMFFLPQEQYNLHSDITYIKRLLIDSLSGSKLFLGGALYDKQSYRYNTVLEISNNINGRIRYKQKLIPFSEYLPKENFLIKFKVFSEDYPIYWKTRKNDNDYFVYEQDTLGVLVCYESIFSDYIASLASQGCELFLIAAGNTYVDNMHNERNVVNILKSISVATRRPMVRAVENGISVFVDHRGNLSNRIIKETVIKIEKMELKSYKTFFSLNYDWLSKIYGCIVVLIYLLAVFAVLRSD